MTRAFAFTALLLLSGCGDLDNCPDAPDKAIVVPPPAGDGGAGSAEATAGVYESSAWDEARTAFPAKTCMRFEHGLGTTPEIVNSYVSFQRSDSDVTENAGNQGRIKCVDSEQIVIKNDTCETDFYIRVVAYASGSGDTSTRCRDLPGDDCARP
jgi:hypothetical protein